MLSTPAGFNKKNRPSNPINYLWNPSAYRFVFSLAILNSLRTYPIPTASFLKNANYLKNVQKDKIWLMFRFWYKF